MVVAVWASTKLVHRLGGAIGVNSSKGNWSELMFWLPIVGAPSARNWSESFAKVAVCFVCNISSAHTRFDMVARHYNIRYTLAEELAELTDAPASDFGGCNIACLVQRDLLDLESWNEIKASSPFENVRLLTFGPAHRVLVTCVAHMKCIHRLFPHALLRQLIENMSKSPLAPPVNETDKDENGDENLFPSLSILVAEDNLVNQKVRILKRLGATDIKVVGNGQQAVDAMLSKSFDVCLMDMQRNNVLQGDRVTRAVHVETSTPSATRSCSGGLQATPTKSLTYRCSVQ